MSGLTIKHAIRRAVVISSVFCTRRIVGVLRNARQLERFAVCVSDVPGCIQYVGRSIRNNRVKVARREIARRLKENRIKLACHGPLVRSGARCNLPQGIERALERWLSEWSDVLKVAEPGHQREVHMRLNEARQYSSSSKVDRPRSASGNRQHLIATADGKNPVA